MIIDENAEPIAVRAGIYKHYKGELYLVEGYSQNASDNNNLQISYVPLYINPEHAGARRVTRDWREFFETVCPIHDGVEAYSDKHGDLRRDNIFVNCNEQNLMERFQYMGPVYYRGFES